MMIFMKHCNNKGDIFLPLENDIIIAMVKYIFPLPRENDIFAMRKCFICHGNMFYLNVYVYLCQLNNTKFTVFVFEKPLSRVCNDKLILHNTF